MKMRFMNQYCPKINYFTPHRTWGNDIFGVPGDFAYPILDGILDDEDIQWRGSCNELNVGYSADGCTSPKKC